MFFKNTIKLFDAVFSFWNRLMTLLEQIERRAMHNSTTTQRIYQHKRALNLFILWILDDGFDPDNAAECIDENQTKPTEKSRFNSSKPYLHAVDTSND